MTNRVIIVNNPFDTEQVYEEHVVTSHAAFLRQKYDGCMPPNVVLYHERVAPENNVTPRDKAGVDRFMALQGDVILVQYPGTGVEVGWVIAAIVFVAALVMMPDAPDNVASGRNNSPPSANNDLSARTNKARPNARIPDIYGKVISTPDLINRTYSIFVEHQEREYSYLCFGRGDYDVSKIKDGTTLFSDIDGAAAAVYGPNTSPNFGTPKLTVGETINEKVLSVVRTEAANGQSLIAPNDDAFVTQIRYRYPNIIEVNDTSDVDFTTLYTAGDIISLSGTVIPRSSNAPFTLTMALSGDNSDISIASDGTVTGWVFTARGGGGSGYEPINGTGVFILIAMAPIDVGGNSINLSGRYVVESDTMTGSFKVRDPDLYNSGWALLGGSPVFTVATVYSGGGGSVIGAELNMSGAYEVDSVSEHSIEFVGPGLVNGAWAWMYTPSGATQPYPPGSTVNATLAINGGIDNWVGPMDIYLDGMTNFIINLVSPGGLYKDDGTTQTAFNIDVEFEATAISESGLAIANPIRIYRTVEGSSITQGQRALTIRGNFDLPPSKGYRFRGRRRTNKDISFIGNSVADVQWKDLYATAPVAQQHFGDVTTIQTVTNATKGALSLKSRQVNAEVWRLIQPLLSDGTFGTATTTRDFADILAAMCLDPKIGGRELSEMNLVNFRAVSDDIKTYFNREAARSFSYTFDDANTSFEEMVTAVAQACFSVIYRRGNILNVKFEKLTTASSLLFNHRNKIPGTEKRTITFGMDGDYDGIEFEYIDPKDSSSQVVFLPADRSAIKAKVIKSVGVRSKTQATLLAYRLWNKMRFRRTIVEFTATAEAALLIRNDRVLCANNVRPNAQDGEVRGKTGTTLTLSQPVKFKDGVDYSIFLQATDGTVVSIPCTAGLDEYHVVLDSEPTASLSINPANYALATYILAPNTGGEPLAFLVEQKTYDGPMSSKVQLVNYDPRYYANDKDFSARLAHYMNVDILYDDATDDQKENGGFYAVNGLIPTVNDPAYVYSAGPDED